MKKLLLLFLIIGLTTSLFAQKKKADSTAVAATLKTLLTLCKNVDWSDRKTFDSGYFYKAAPYIIYRGDDKKRAWKVFANYKLPEDKLIVDGACEKVNQTINQDSTYKIVKYHTETESEGTWHVLLVTYIKKGKERRAAFAFLKVSGRFGLGDID